MNTQAPMQQKKELITHLLSQGMITITLDARRAGVWLPVEYLHDPKLVLNLSYKFGTKMEITDKAILANLSFNGNPFMCAIPWECIWMVQQGKDGIVFPEAIPDRELIMVPKEKVIEGKEKFTSLDGGGEASEPRTGHLKMLH